MSGSARNAIFISHATPEDNAETLWLGTKLTAMGYEVWADLFRLRGGNDWERILENAIREKTRTFLLIGKPESVKKQGVRNEITMASDVSRKIGDPDFIIPLKFAPYDAPYLIVHAQYIDFERGWAEGFRELLSVLEELQVPRGEPGPNAEIWNWVSTKDAKQIASSPETLVSNWLPIERLPDAITFYDFRPGISIGAAQSAIGTCSVPVVSQNRGFLSFAPIDQLQPHFGDGLPLEVGPKKATEYFLDEGWTDLGIPPHEARKKFTDLSRRAFDNFFHIKGLQAFEFASGRTAWWPSKDLATMNMRSFSWPDGPSGRRQLVGESRVRHAFWHYGVNCWTRTSPVRHVRVGARVIFTTNGLTPIGDARRVHRMRRSFCKSWRNDKWRDLHLAFWHWIGEGSRVIAIPFGDGTSMGLKLPPQSFQADFGIETLDDHHQGADYEDDEDVTDDDGPEGDYEGDDEDDDA